MLKRIKKIFLVVVLSLSLIMGTGISMVEVEASNDPTIADYWDGNAHFELHYSKSVSSLQDAASTNICVVNGTWYWFQRYETTEGKLGTECRSSTDGQNWSNAVKVLEPTAGTPWSMCVTDGKFLYDANANKWRCLIQILGDSGVWNAGYFERAGSDPMGPFTEPSGFTNPAINNKEIWSQIADNSNDDCVQLAGGTNLIYDEGTFDIPYVDGNTFYVTFHGAFNVGSTIHGVRGIATTTDFQNYTPANSDCIFDEYDSDSWNVDWYNDESIGVGAACTIKEGDYWYTIIEGADRSLVMAEDQNWTWGLYRSTTLTSKNWTGWSNNPMPLLAPNREMIEWAYGNLFKDDDGVTYLSIDKLFPASERSVRVYKLVSGAPTPTPTTVDDNGGSVSYTGSGWAFFQDSNWYNSSVHYTKTTGDYAEFTFTGTEIRVVALKNSVRGLARIYVDSVDQGTVDLYNPTNLFQQEVFIKTGLTSGSHTIKVECTGTKNPSATDSYIEVDAFKYTDGGGSTITPTLINNDNASITYGTGWSYHDNRGLGDYNDDVHYATGNGSYFEYTFTGTGIEYVSPKNPQYGDVDIYIDNVFQQTVSSYAASYTPQQVLYSKLDLMPGSHTIKGVKVNNNYIVVDAFKVYN